MNILITGAFGFVGANLSKSIKTAFNCRLIAVDQIHLVAQRPPAEGHRHYSECISWNELHTLKGTPIDAIIHLAGKAHDTKNTTGEQTYFDVNLGLTQKIYEFFLQSAARKFIFFSSVKAAADTVTGDFLNEEAEPAPGTPYGRSKLAAENYLRENNKQQTTNKSTYVLRPCMIHGPGNKGNLNLLYRLVQKNIPWPLGAFENRRSFASVDNVAYVVKEILEKDIAPGTYNMADDEPLSTNRLIELIAESNGKKARVWNMNPNVIKRLAGLGDFFTCP